MANQVSLWRIKAAELLKTKTPNEVSVMLFKESGYKDLQGFRKKVGQVDKIKKAVDSFLKTGEYKEVRDESGKVSITDVVDRRLTDDELFERYGRSKEDWRISMVWFKDRQSGFLLSCCFIPLKKENEQRNFAAELKKELKSVSPSVPLKKRSKINNGKLLEIDIFDPHFGKLAWGEETGENYDIKIAEERYMTALSELLHRASGGDKIEKILFPIGNDLMHTDTTTSTTTGNTQQDCDVRWQKMWLHTRAAIMRGIKMATEVAPVDIVIVPSNHDFQTIFYLGDLLECYYQNDKNISVNNSPKTRKYYRFGKCGIGFTHGNEENHNDLAIIMLREMQKEWGDVEYMEWHLGHFHKKKDIRFKSSDDYKGIMVRLLRSLSSADSWHARRGYVSTIKGAEAFIWDKEFGVTANLMHNL